jgi:hypothetical protein
MVQMTVYHVVGVVTVRNRFVSALRTVLVPLGMSATIVLRRTIGRIRSTHGEGMFLNAAGPHVVEMPVVQVIDMAIVFDGRVPAAGAVLMIVIRMMCLCSAHVVLSFCWSLVSSRWSAANSVACASAL